MISLYWKVILSLISVLLLMLGMLFLLKRAKGYARSNGSLTIDETLALDSKRRIVLVKYKNSKYLLLIGGSTDILIQREDVV